MRSVTPEAGSTTAASTTPSQPASRRSHSAHSGGRESAESRYSSSKRSKGGIVEVSLSSSACWGTGSAQLCRSLSGRSSLVSPVCFLFGNLRTCANARIRYEGWRHPHLEVRREFTLD